MEDLCKAYEEGRHEVHVHQIRAGPSLMDLIVLFLKKDILPESKFEANKIWRKAPRFWPSGDQKLYKRSFSGPYLLCVHPEAVELLLEELHEGICGSHTEGRSLSHRALTQGLLVAEHAKRSTGICEEVRPMPKVCAKHPSTKRSP